MTKNIVVFGCSLTWGHFCSDREQGLTWGTLPSEFCWASLLQKDHPDFKVYNYSSPGSGNISTFGNLFKRKQPHSVENLNLNEDPIDLVFFAMTYFPRFDILKFDYNPVNDMSHPYYYQDDNPNGHGLLDHERTRHCGHSHHRPFNSEGIEDEEYLMAIDLYSRRLHSSSVQVQQALATLLALYGIAQIKNAKFVWSSTVDPMQFIYKEHHMTELLDCRVEEIREYLLHKPQARQYFPLHVNDYHPNDLGHRVYYEEVIKPKINKLQL